MGKLVTPEVFLIGYSTLDWAGLIEYLKASGNDEFLKTAEKARQNGVSEGEVMCSFYAKLCYSSLSLGHNDNLTRVRDIPDNFKACLDQGHGSVLEHCTINFVARNVSRVLTHETVRHRAGTAFSQTSGRYVRTDSVDVVFDPILDPVREDFQDVQTYLESAYLRMVKKMGLDEETDLNIKKAKTSALRRMLPNGQSNELGFTVNLRALRHTVQIRTSRFAEWEIRNVFEQVYKLVKKRFPLIFSDAKEEVVCGLTEVTGMRQQPYDRR